MTQEKALRDKPMHYCPGCGHGVIHRILCDVIDELGIRERTIGVAPVGCAVVAYDYWNFDVTESAHGRAPAVATGIKRVLPENIVFTYQGDGDLAAIGTSEIIHAANRGEKITTLFVNNSVYGMTGGQMAPTTMLNQRTTTSLKGRSASRDGFPIKISEMISILPGAVYVERTAVHTKELVEKTREALKKAFKIQIEEKGFSLVEILSPCPVYGAKSVKEAYKRIDEEIIKFYPLGILKG